MNVLSAVLAVPPIDTPLRAVPASIVADSKRYRGPNLPGLPIAGLQFHHAPQTLGLDVDCGLADRRAGSVRLVVRSCVLVVFRNSTVDGIIQVCADDVLANRTNRT